MAVLPNGFTGYNNVDPSFESAASSMRAAEPLTDEARRAADEAFLAKMGPLEQRWAWMQVDLSAIRANVAETRRFLNARCQLMAVVKANGYGHGAVEVAKAAIGAGADQLGVATVAEGIELREAGVTAPVVLLSQPPAASIPLLLAYHITPSVYDVDFALTYGETADVHGREAPYHLAVNTGMNRIGVRYDDVIEFLRRVGFHRALKLEGTFTHYATADSAESMDFDTQTRRFLEAVNDIQAAGFDPGVVHAANSAAIYRYPEVHFGMVRLGLAMYGLHPCPETRNLVDLRPAMSVHARIVDERVVPMSEGVSYGMRYRSPGFVKICTLPIGYADGLRRSLSGVVDFIYNGRYVRQVGEICMDHCMFEVDMRSSTRRERLDPQVGEEVLVVGAQGVAEMTLDELAEKAGTNTYEIAIGFGQRLARIYT